MNEIALHILDIAQNSISAGGKKIVIKVIEDKGILTFSISDDGKGMEPELLKRVTSPFTTSRTTRKVGLGIPLLKMTAEMTGGTFSIESAVGRGTTMVATYDTSSLDMLPLGDMASTMMLLIQQKPDIHFVYERKIGDMGFCLDTNEISELLEGVPLDTPEVLDFILSFVNENENELTKGQHI